MKKSLFIVLLLLGFNVPIFSQGLYHPYNLDFEDGEKGKLPRGWTIPSYAVNADYSAELTDLQPHGGKLCFELHRMKIDNKYIYGSVMQTVDAKQYRGKTVKLRAAVRAEISSITGSAHLWIRERFENEGSGLFEMMEDRPIVINKWQVYEITGKIDENADFLNFGLLLKGSGKAWIDDATFEIIETKEENLTAARSISTAGIENLLAFAKLYGIARYFSATNESLENDWDRFALLGVENFEQAENNINLVDLLNKFYKKFIPELELIPMKEYSKKDFPKSFPPDALSRVALGWKHVGPPTVKDSKIFYSRVENIFKSQREKEGSVFQMIDAVPLQGKEVRFSCSVKTYLVAPSGQAQLWLRVDKEEDKPILMKTMDDNPIESKDWKEFSLSVVIPANAKILRLGLVLIGEGSALFDDAKLMIVDNGKEEKFDVKNPGFEDSELGPVARGWLFNNSSTQAGYSAIVTGKQANSGAKGLLISSSVKDRISFPELKETIVNVLNDDFMYRIPLNYFVDSAHTLPYPPKKLELPRSSKPEKFEFNGKDRTSRLADVIMLWNIYSHFNLFNDNEAVWEKAFKEAIKKAATDKTEKDFLQTLQVLSSYLNDASARVWFGDDNTRFGLPFLWKWIDGKLVIYETHKDFTDFKPGDVVLSIEGKPAADYVKNIEKKISASTDGWKKLRALAEIRAGKENTTLSIKVEKQDKSVIEKNVDRNVSLNELTEKRPPEFAAFDKRIYYVDLTRLNDEGLKAIIDTLKNANGIIFDLRGAAVVSEHALGLLSNDNMKSVEWLIPVYTKPFQGLISNRRMTNEIKGRKKLAGVKSVFLVDERTIGYSEAMVTIIKQNHLGEVIGTKTAGTCGETAGFRMPGNYNFSWTIIKGVDANEQVIYGGVLPTIPVSPTMKGVSEGKDEIFDKAIEVLLTPSGK